MLLLLALTMVRASSLVPSLPGLHNYICPDYPYCFLDSSSGRWSSWKLKEVQGSVVSTRVGNTASCWLEGEHCTVEDSNTLQLVDGPKDAASCQLECGETDGCRYFTFLRIRGRPQCFLLSQCSSAVGCPEQVGSDCQSGPRACECTTLPAPKEDLLYARWKCGDKDPYTESVPVGTSCSASCPAWAEGDARPRALHTSCMQGGHWSLISRPSGRSAMEGEDLEGQTPDQVDIPCGCGDLGGFLYDPNEEENTEFSCEGRDADHFQSGWWHLNTADRCKLTCNNVLSASVFCRGNQWTGKPELGFWCFSSPELPGPQTDINATLLMKWDKPAKGTTISADGSSWTQGGGHDWQGVIADQPLCTYSFGLYEWTVSIEKGTYHQVGVALGDWNGLGSSSSGSKEKFAVLYSHSTGWDRYRGAATPEGSPDTKTWWSGTWDSQGKGKEITVKLDCTSRTFEVKTEQQYLGTMKYPDSWEVVYAAAAGQSSDHVYKIGTVHQTATSGGL